MDTITIPKLRKIFRKVGYRVVFKSKNPNLKPLLTCKNKLPHNSQPGTYLIECSCSKSYVGETKLQIRTRTQEQQKNLNEGKQKSVLNFTCLKNETNYTTTANSSGV